MKKLLLFLLTCLILLTGSCIKQEEIKPEETKQSVPLFPVCQNGKWGYIDKTGKMVIKPQFNCARSFSEGLARVWIDGKMGYINKTGKYIWKSTD